MPLLEQIGQPNQQILQHRGAQEIWEYFKDKVVLQGEHTGFPRDQISLVIEVSLVFDHLSEEKICDKLLIKVGISTEETLLICPVGREIVTTWDVSGQKLILEKPSTKRTLCLVVEREG